MGDLIVMSRAKPLPLREWTAGHSAEILFFTGVRYYRLDEPVATSSQLATPASTRTKRRRSTEQRRTAKRLREQRLEALA